MAEKKAATKKKSTTATSKPGPAPAKKAVAKKAVTKKTAPVKKAASPKKAAPRSKKTGTTRVSEEMRQHMIREAAYYRALHRGFGEQADQDDWFAAEREIDIMLGKLVE